MGCGMCQPGVCWVSSCAVFRMRLSGARQRKLRREVLCSGSRLHPETIDSGAGSGPCLRRRGQGRLPICPASASETIGSSVLLDLISHGAPLRELFERSQQPLLVGIGSSIPPCEFQQHDDEVDAAAGNPHQQAGELLIFGRGDVPRYRGRDGERRAHPPGAGRARSGRPARKVIRIPRSVLTTAAAKEIEQAHGRAACALLREA